MSENYSSDTSLDLEVGGVIIPMIIDSGASCIILGRERWHQLKSSNMQCVSSKDTKTLYVYGSICSSRWEGTIVVGTLDSSEIERFEIGPKC